METYKIEITIDNLDFASYTGIMSTLKHMIENSKHEIKVCDGKNVDTSERQLTIPVVSESFIAKCDVCGCHPSVIIRTEFGTFCQAHARYVR